MKGDGESFPSSVLSSSNEETWEGHSDDSEADVSELDEPIADGLSLFCLWGSEYKAMSGVPLTCFQASGFDEMLSVLATVGHGIDIC